MAVQISYEGEKVVEEDDLSLSLLDISLKHGLPHLHTCGRSAACTTCQVEILGNLENVVPRNPVEEKFASKHKLDDNIRLACQTYLTGPVTLRRHLQEDIDVDQAILESVQLTGSEQNLAILFCDIRDFTGLSGRMLPYDMFYVLNRYYQQMGECVLAHHGYLHQYYGDGMMALFGFYARETKQICLDAVTAGLKMLDALKDFNRFLETNFKEQFQIGIGVHFGKVLAGKIGHTKNRHLTVLGDVVNTTQRIQDATKQAEFPLLISDQVYWELGATILKVRPLRAQLKGKPGEHRLYEVMGFAKGHGQPLKRHGGFKLGLPRFRHGTRG